MTRSHDPTYNYARGRVTLTCRCGFVRRYDDEATARRAYASHAHGGRRKEERKEGEAA